jgi:hypothetical protein
MEQVISIARRLGGVSATTQTSTPQPQILQSISDLLKQVRANYPNQEISTETAKVWLKQWAEFASAAGIDTLRRALWLCMSESDFLPQPSAVKRAVKKLMAKKVTEERVNRPIGDCGICDNQRLVVTERIVDGERRTSARDCECLVEWRRAKQMREVTPAHDGKAAAVGA